jgi:hypothetical protein
LLGIFFIEFVVAIFKLTIKSSLFIHLHLHPLLCIIPMIIIWLVIRILIYNIKPVIYIIHQRPKYKSPIINIIFISLFDDLHPILDKALVFQV